MSDDVLVETEGVGDEGAPGVDRFAVSVLASSVLGSACRLDEGVCEGGTEDTSSKAFFCVLAESEFSGGSGSDAAFPSTGSVSLAMSEEVNAAGGELEAGDTGTDGREAEGA